MQAGLNEAGSPAARATLRRAELAAGGLLAALLLLGGLLHTAGFLEEPPVVDASREHRPFRPRVADFEGDVRYDPAGSAPARPLHIADSFAPGDLLETGPDGTLDVFLTWEGAGVRLGPNSRLTWRKLLRRGELYDVAVLARGKVLCLLERYPTGSRFLLDTGTKVIEHVGTVFSIDTEEAGGAVNVLSGAVDVVDRSDPDRRVRVEQDQRVSFRAEGWDPEVGVLSAVERAELLGELISAREHIDRLALPETVAAAEAEDGAAAEDADAAAAATPSPTPAPGSDQAQDLEEVLRVLRTGLELLDAGQVEAALALCTPTFRAVLRGEMVGRSQVLQEIARDEQGDATFVIEGSQLDSLLDLGLRIERLTAVIDGDVAYGSATVAATAFVRANEQTVVRRYACTGRCLRQPGGGWLVDLATASELGD